MIKLLSFLLAISIGCMAFASGSSVVRDFPADGTESFQATKSMKCVIAELRAPNLVLMTNPKTGEQTAFRVAEKARIRSKVKEAFHGRKRLKFTDLAVGQAVKITFHPETREITSIKVLKISRSVVS